MRTPWIRKPAAVVAMNGNPRSLTAGCRGTQLRGLIWSTASWSWIHRDNRTDGSSQNCLAGTCAASHWSGSTHNRSEERFGATDSCRKRAFFQGRAEDAQILLTEPRSRLTFDEVERDVRFCGIQANPYGTTY
ncbi:hypothetical protein [Streptomyces sp. NPDC002889]|uniref:hypothetical protein n=1 Tax=Streptomyces sp. NPDC002889 TaxID=3364669 RepID=UPI00369EB5B0